MAWSLVDELFWRLPFIICTFLERRRFVFLHLRHLLWKRISQIKFKSFIQYKCTLTYIYWNKTKLYGMNDYVWWNHLWLKGFLTSIIDVEEWLKEKVAESLSLRNKERWTFSPLTNLEIEAVPSILLNFWFELNDFFWWKSNVLL